MANRTRDYYRHQRARAIKRKKRICEKAKHLPFYYPVIGHYSKGKIHCSCPMCREKDFRGRHILDLSEIKSIMRLEEELDDYNSIRNDKKSTSDKK